MLDLFEILFDQIYQSTCLGSLLVAGAAIPEKRREKPVLGLLLVTGAVSEERGKNLCCGQGLPRATKDVGVIVVLDVLSAIAYFRLSVDKYILVFDKRFF
ncbi:unnamed protein product [Cuscuta epithymum]|uniref:Uncharacterized protein n=1 Tax=Cuscuta epithymum TaxID=186058 RepID=A0AAV0FCS6_9ASTE|nr:unnamed protein product [Cuscuta epithymum]